MDRRKNNRLNYQDEYKETINKKSFMKLVLKRYPKLKESTAQRRWYDCKKVLGEQQDEPIQKSVFAEDIPVSKPPTLKMIQFEDMKRMKYKITKEFLRKYGYNYDEINWLEKHGEI